MGNAKVRRWDAGEVSKIEHTDQGYLRCDARITRTGVFDYRLPDGTVRSELRLPCEVFAEDALASFGFAPLTDGHPPRRQPLTSHNTGKYQVGSVIWPHQDGEFVVAKVQITDASAIAKAESGAKRQLSCGYNCDLEPTSGITAGIDGIPDGLHFDAIQRHIRGNHVALVTDGRAGPDASLRMDESDGYQVNSVALHYDRDPSAVQSITFAPSSQYDQGHAEAWAKVRGFAAPLRADEADGALCLVQRDESDFADGSLRQIELADGITARVGRRIDKKDIKQGAVRPSGVAMDAKITIDGVTYEVTEQVEQAVGKLTSRIDQLEASVKESETSIETERARADAAEEKCAAAEKAREDAIDPVRVREAVDARLGLERAAQPILGSEVKVDSLSDHDIMHQVVLAVSKDKEATKAKLDGASDVYLQARYDAALEIWDDSQKPNEGLANVRRAGKAVTKTDTVDDARARMIERNIEAGRKALN